jgi:hypothetical protein
VLSKRERVVILVSATVGVIFVAMTFACSSSESDQEVEQVGVELIVEPVDGVTGATRQTVTEVSKSDEDKIDAEEAEAEALPPIEDSE